ncbi:MAG TPA: 30S ribosomal protein S12 methylthiotransferase RimO, partial [Bacteroidales bacterium]|nr:30S ribosomal protein S12 methylthiotransferase RimO [Bacteroidales bacterium]
TCTELAEKLIRQLSAGGYEVVYDPEDTTAGTVIINTCGFIRDSKEESIDTILKFTRAKQKGQISNLYVMGCLAERYMQDLQHEIPEVQRYFGVNNLTDVLHEVGLNLRDDLLTGRMLTGPDHYAYLKISEGCDRTCAFCAIPGIRGKYISRPVKELISEASQLADSGVKEIILIAQDLSYYGLDLYKKQELQRLVRELLKVPFEWIRLHYLYPANFPTELLDIMQSETRICKYIDIPIQHISDKMLRLMKRSHSRKETEQVLHKIRKKLPDAAIRSTLIVGHPGETEDDFKELRDFVNDFRFDRLGVFAYSHEEDTYSYKNYKDEISDNMKEARVSELMEIQQEISLSLNESKIDKSPRIIVDRREGEFFIGRTEHDSPEVDQEVLVPAEYNMVPGNFYDIRITEAREFDLYGKPV